jgi:hypothetical protein
MSGEMNGAQNRLGPAGREVRPVPAVVKSTSSFYLNSFGLVKVLEGIADHLVLVYTDKGREGI